ncbi:hypothetical protein EVAR_89708_1 [Eumeta japonica]|uniref:Uncharacterized protein n=1 Tax=Eumeta variegata TaxID=151549 RepID=A0A4C1WYW9_EUMVA|nr:hypothetical protein EVAR_89708_1 [Eumeta japonica]
MASARALIVIEKWVVKDFALTLNRVPVFNSGFGSIFDFDPNQAFHLNPDPTLRFGPGPVLNCDTRSESVLGLHSAPVSLSTIRTN